MITSNGMKGLYTQVGVPRRVEYPSGTFMLGVEGTEGNSDHMLNPRYR